MSTLSKSAAAIISAWFTKALVDLAATGPDRCKKPNRPKIGAPGMIGRLLCRLGRHRWEYLIFHDDDLVRWCPRCRRPNALTIIPAKRIQDPKMQQL